MKNDFHLKHYFDIKILHPVLYKFHCYIIRCSVIIVSMTSIMPFTDWEHIVHSLTIQRIQNVHYAPSL